MNLEEQHPNVYIILVNYGNWKDTANCLQSIESCYNGLSIIIVDVCNLYHSFRFLLELTTNLSHNRYKIVEQKENMGFAAACNLGLKTITEKHPDSFIWILNNDTTINTETIPNLIRCFKNNLENRTAFIGSLILDYSDRNLIQYAGGYIDKKWAIIKVLKEGENLSKVNLPEEVTTDWVMGASMFFHSSIINEIGFMPEDYFLYYEDIEWSLQAIRKGYNNIVSTKSHVYHKQGSSTGLKYSTGQSFNPISAKYYYSNYLKFFARNFPIKLNTARFMLIKKILRQFLSLNFRHSAIILEALVNQLKSHGTRD